MEETINLSIKDYLNNSKKSDWWIWVVATIFILGGISLSVAFSFLLVDSYKTTAILAAYSGAIVSGLTLSLAGLTQILVFLHRKQDEKAKKLEKVEHDYTNFFIKNYHWNEMISLILSHVNRELGIQLSFDSKKVTIKYDDSISSFMDLRKKYIYSLATNLFGNDLLISMLKNSYNYQTGSNINKDLFNSFSAFDTEIKKSAMSVEKILQARCNHKYEDNFYNFNMKDRLKDYSMTIMAYFLIIIHDNKNYNFAIKAVDLLPFMIYYLCTKD